MPKLKKISTNIPEDLLIKACSISSLNQTEALIAGLTELIARHERSEVIKLRGKIKINYNPEQARQRVRL